MKKVLSLITAVLVSATTVTTQAEIVEAPPTKRLSLKEQVKQNTTNIETNSQDIITNLFVNYDNTILINKNTADISELKASTNTIDYRDYLTDSSISQKTFSLTAPTPSLACLPTIAVFDYTRDSNSTTERRTYKNDIENCSVTERVYGSDDNYSLYLSYTLLDRLNPNNAIFTENFGDGVKLYGSADKVGDTIVDTVPFTKQFNYGQPDETYYLNRTATISRLESVTVPYNGGTTYENCRVSVFFWSQSNYSNPPRPTHVWTCPGVGVVKRTAGNFGILELTDMVVN